MNKPALLNESKVADLNEIRAMIDRLKSQSKSKYTKDLENTNNIEIDESYLRGYYFGQLAALEDCYHLIVVLLESVKTTSMQEHTMLMQQFDTLISKLEINNNTNEYVTAVKNYLHKLIQQ